MMDTVKKCLKFNSEQPLHNMYRRNNNILSHCYGKTLVARDPYNHILV